MAIKPVEIEIRAKDKATATVKGVAAAVGDIAPASQRAGAASDAALGGMHQRGLKAADGIKSISEQLAFVQKALVTFQGGSFLSALIKDTAQTADEYANLSARIKLATGDGEAFEQAMSAVTDISLRTNSSLQATGNLFARLTDAGKSAGLSAQDAQAQALSLTESINQAVAVSGSSAQASDAALTQLIQGLQSGVLRGEEFNSVMEQSPRLARALADGLGVTTGELRKMANEGRLTSEVVIQALKSQSDTLKAEFETLPPTIGRAVQNLATSWTVYVGEADKATGASQLAAKAIESLAANLDTVAGYLLDAGQAAAAFAALRLAQTFLGIGAAATTSATAIAANTVAMSAANVASAGAAAGVGRFAAILGGLKTFSLLGLVTNFKDIGTFIGEGIAKLQGYRDMTAEVEKAERSRVMVAEEQRKIVDAQTAANKAAADAQFELSKAAQSSLAVFDDLVAKGKTAGEAVADIGKDFDLASLPGIANAAAVLDKLAADGKISADQFGAAWAAALKGEDLQVFEVKARAALAGTARESERLAAVIDGTLREAIRRSGGDFDVLAGGMSKAARSAINDTDTIINGLDRLKAQGVDVGQALELSLNKAIKTADSQTAIDALRSRVEQLRNVLGDQVANTFLDQIATKARQITQEVGSLSEALKKLGITSDTDLKLAANASKLLYEQVRATGGSAREQGEAFRKMAADAIASGDTAALSFVKTQAAIHGLEITTDAAGKTIVRAMGEAAGAYRNMAQSAEAAAAAAQKLAAINAKYASPLGADKYSAPAGGSVTGSTRAERLAGQNAVDNSLQFSLRDKLNSGSLTEDDVGDLRNVITALKQREQIDSDVDRMNPGAFSNQGMADRLAWQRSRVYFEQALASLTGSSGTGSAVGRTVQVQINTARGTETVNTDEAGAAALVRSLQAASLAAGK